MLTTAVFDPLRWMPKTSETPMHYWMSLSPMAPAFGVRYRFATSGAKDKIFPPKSAKAAAPKAKAAKVQDAEIVKTPAPAKTPASFSVQGALDIEPAPKPVAAKPAPVAKPEPVAAKPAPIAKPAPVAKPEPVAAKSEPVAAKPAPVAKPEPLAKPEPVAAKPEPVAAKPEPVAKPAPVVEAKKPALPDDLTVIKGIGPKLSAELNDLGITRFAEIAAWTKADEARIEEQLGGLPGKVERDKWVAQAKSLAGN